MAIKLVVRKEGGYMQVREHCIDDLRIWLTMQAIDCEREAEAAARYASGTPDVADNGYYRKMRLMATCMRTLSENCGRQFASHKWTNAAWSMLSERHRGVVPDDLLLPPMPDDTVDNTH